MDFDGTVTKIEMGEEQVDGNLYIDVINVSIEAEGHVNGIKITDTQKENSLLLPLTATGIGLGLAVAYAAYKKKKREYDSRVTSTTRQGKRLPPSSRKKQEEVVGSSENGRPVYEEAR